MSDNVILPAHFQSANVIVKDSEEWKQVTATAEKSKQLEEEVKQLKQLQTDVEERQRAEVEINNKTLVRLHECEKELKDANGSIWKMRFLVLLQGVIIAGLIFLKLKF